MKVLTVLGTRPEIIRLSLIIRQLDQMCDHVLVHTGQNYDVKLSEMFFDQMEIRRPDYMLGVRGESPGEQIGQIISRTESVFKEEKPDRLLLLGDTNSALCAMMAKRLGVPVYHMEAGNRCYDDRVPEEVNRRIIDHSSDVLLPYTENSRKNLLREGIDPDRVYVTGNPIGEVISHYAPQIKQSNILEQMQVLPQHYFLATLHRAENVDLPKRLSGAVAALVKVAEQYGYPVLISTHPRTRLRLEQAEDLPSHPLLRFLDPFGFFDFIALEQQALAVLSDSGTVQEECAIFKVPNVTLRDVTERPETMECGSNIISGIDTESILTSLKVALHQPPAWQPPPEYVLTNVADTVTRIVLSYRQGRGNISL